MSIPLITDYIDWECDADGDLIIPLRYTTGIRAIAQGIRIRIQNIRGEWFLDLDDGVPWFENASVAGTSALLGQRYSAIRTAAEIRKAINTTPGVLRIDDLALSFNGATRQLSIRWHVRSVFGDTITDSLIRTV